MTAIKSSFSGGPVMNADNIRSRPSKIDQEKWDAVFGRPQGEPLRENEEGSSVCGLPTPDTEADRGPEPEDGLDLAPIEFPVENILDDPGPIPTLVEIGHPLVDTAIYVSWMDKAVMTIGYKVEATAFTVAVLRAALHILITITSVKEQLLMQPDPWYKQRRIWVTVIGAGVFVAGLFKVDTSQFNTETMADQVMTIATGISGLISAGLALWSYIKPKPKP